MKLSNVKILLLATILFGLMSLYPADAAITFSTQPNTTTGTMTSPNGTTVNFDYSKVSASLAPTVYNALKAQLYKNDPTWPSDESKIIFLTSADFPTQISWTDWNRVGFSASYVSETHNQGGEVLSFITVKSQFNRVTFPVYRPDADGDYDLSYPPYNKVLNRASLVNHWGDIQDNGRTIFTRPTFVFGISPKGFKIGSTSTGGAVDTSTTSYMLGGGLMFNPYVSGHIGIATTDGRNAEITAGVVLDIGIINEIFK